MGTDTETAKPTVVFANFASASGRVFLQIPS